MLTEQIIQVVLGCILSVLIEIFRQKRENNYDKLA